MKRIVMFAMSIAGLWSWTAAAQDSMECVQYSWQEPTRFSDDYDAVYACPRPGVSERLLLAGLGRAKYTITNNCNWAVQVRQVDNSCARPASGNFEVSFELNSGETSKVRAVTGYMEDAAEIEYCAHATDPDHPDYNTCPDATNQPKLTGNQSSVGQDTASADQAGSHGQGEEALTHAQRIQVQRSLAALGYDAGPADGMFGSRTREAIREWQRANGLKATGYLTRDEVDALAGTGAASSEGEAAELSPKCAEMQKGASCWWELVDPPGCYIFDYYYNPPGTATWSGTCSGGVAVGRGTWKWQLSAGSGEGTGTLVHGKLHGRWVERWASGFVREGPFVDGERNGHWVERHPDGAVQEGPFEGGERNGHWVERHPDGSVQEGPYVDSKRNGTWVYRLDDGSCVVKVHYSHGVYTDTSDC